MPKWVTSPIPELLEKQTELLAVGVWNNPTTKCLESAPKLCVTQPSDQIYFVCCSHLMMWFWHQAVGKQSYRDLTC